MTTQKRKATAQPSTPIEVYRERIASVLPLECPGDRVGALRWIATVAGWLAQHYAQDRQTLAALLPPKEWGNLDSDDLWYEREQYNRYSIAISHMENLMPILREAVKLHIPEAFTTNFHRYCLPSAAQADPDQATDAWREVARLAELALHADKPTGGEPQEVELKKTTGKQRGRKPLPKTVKQYDRKVFLMRRDKKSYEDISYALEITVDEAKQAYDRYRHTPNGKKILQCQQG